MVSTSTIVTASITVTVSGLLAYAVYFDHRRRTDPNFRKELKRESKRMARAAREEAEANQLKLKSQIKETVRNAVAEGFPVLVEDKEAYFMDEVYKGEQLSQAGTDDLAAALHLYKALKVYPEQTDLVGIYDKTIPKPVLDVLAEMIALDQNLNHLARLGRGGRASAEDEMPTVGLD